jgi:hypothetical protein
MKKGCFGFVVVVVARLFDDDDCHTTRACEQEAHVGREN